jgi:DNA-directed RNA polymerase specialized sigma24 family protein
MVEVAYGDAMEAEQADFADFFRAEYETLLRAIYLISGSRDEAEELAQDTFVKACERWDRVREMENPPGISIERR